MKKILLLISFAHFMGCHSRPSLTSAACEPDTTMHSVYSFVDAEGNFIGDSLILRMYDASNNLAGYSGVDSCFGYNKTKTVASLLLRLKKENWPLFQKLIKGEISACDTTHAGNHQLVPFVPVQ